MIFVELFYVSTLLQIGVFMFNLVINLICDFYWQLLVLLSHVDYGLVLDLNTVADI